MNITRKLIFHSIIIISFFIGSIIIMAEFFTLTDEQAKLNIFIIIIIMGFYAGLVNIFDIDNSKFVKQYTFKSNLKKIGFILISMTIFVLLLVITYGLFIERISLTFSYVEENIDYLIVFISASAYTCYIFGLYLFFMKKSPENLTD